MRYQVIATDYDGTIATHGAVDEDTVSALERLRKSGRQIVLVTGRELEDLLRILPRPELFDRIVAENGALVYNPSDRRVTQLGEPPPASARSRVAGPRRRAALRRPRDRVVLGAQRGRSARRNPEARARASGDLQQGRGDGAPARRQQGQWPGRRARAVVAVAAQCGRHRRRRERSRVPEDMRMRRRRGQRVADGEGARRPGDARRARRGRDRADRARACLGPVGHRAHTREASAQHRHDRDEPARTRARVRQHRHDLRLVRQWQVDAGDCAPRTACGAGLSVLPDRSRR